MCSGGLATHSGVTKHFVAGATHSAHVPWPNIRFMPLATFHHFSVYPCVDLDYCTTVDAHATLFTQISWFFGPFLRNIVTYVTRPLTADLFSSRLHIENFAVCLLFWLLTSRSLSQNCASAASQIFENIIRAHSEIQLPLSRHKSVSQLSAGNPYFHPPDPRATVFSFQ